MCTACTTCRKQQSQYRAKGEKPPEHAWNALITYDGNNNTLTKEYTPPSFHGDFQYIPTWSQVTSTTESAMQKKLTEPGRHSANDLLEIAQNLQEVLPDKRWVQNYMNNFRTNHKGTLPERPKAHEWCESDWKQLAREFPAFDDVAATAPNELAVVQMCLEPKNTCIVIVNPALTKATLQRMANHDYVKLCGNGTHRVMDEQWLLLTLGVATKHYSGGEQDRMLAFRTTYSPLLFAITNTESEATYRVLFQAGKHVAQSLTGANWEATVRQYHCDWHIGEDNARAQEFPNSVRIGDWAHFVGATAFPRAHLPTATKGEAAEKRKAWRTGFFTTFKKALQVSAHIDFVSAWINFLHVQPTSLLFTTLADYFFQPLENIGEGRCRTVLQRFYFKKMPATEARAKYAIRTWQGDPVFIWTADWWFGLERVQPGSAGATQAQESWHRHGLKNFIRTLRQPVTAVLKRLQQYTSLRLQTFTETQGVLPDTPTEPFPDPYLMEGDMLSRRGRTGAYG